MSSEGRFRLSLGLVPGDGVCGWGIVKRASGCFSLVGSGAFRMGAPGDLSVLRRLSEKVRRLISKSDNLVSVTLQTWPLGTGDSFIKSTFEEGWDAGVRALRSETDAVSISDALRRRRGRFHRAFETGLFSAVLAAPARSAGIPVSIHSAGVLALMVERSVYEEGSKVFPSVSQEYWGDYRRFLAVSLSVSIEKIKTVPEVQWAVLAAMAGSLRYSESGGFPVINLANESSPAFL